MISMTGLRKLRIAALNRLFKWTVGRLPAYQVWSDEINVISDCDQAIKSMLFDHLKKLKEAGVEKPTLLDVGGREGERKVFAKGYEYVGMDIEPKSESFIQADICNCPHIADESFDVIMSFDVFEHLERPWDAAKECVRILKPNGLMVHRTLFAYRYHPCPIDYWRFSSQGLEYLFQRTGKMQTLLSGYDLRIRRHDKRSLMAHGKDSPPLDYLGGFRENWRVLYIGRKCASTTD